MNWQKLQNLKGYGDVKQYVTTLENDAGMLLKNYKKYSPTIQAFQRMYARNSNVLLLI